LRDLTGVHLPFLLNLKNRCLAAIRSRFSVPASQIRAFVHYQPTFYHFHVHFAHISFLPSGGGVASGRGTILRLFSLVLAFFFLFVESSLTFFLQLYCWMI
jgi:m7GpppX diphosphatase